MKQFSHDKTAFVFGSARHWLYVVSETDSPIRFKQTDVGIRSTAFVTDEELQQLAEQFMAIPPSVIVCVDAKRELLSSDGDKRTLVSAPPGDRLGALLLPFLKQEYEAVGEYEIQNAWPYYKRDGWRYIVLKHISSSELQEDHAGRRPHLSGKMASIHRTFDAVSEAIQ